MGFFSRFFEGDRLPESLQISDWLDNLIDQYLKRVGETLDSNPHSAQAMADFTVLAMLQFTRSVLHLQPKCIPVLECVAAFARLYYECLWQRVLLERCESDADIDKIRHLYGWVDHHTGKVLSQIMNSDVEYFQRLFSLSIGTSYSETMPVAIELFINGGSQENTGKEDPFEANATVLWDQVGSCLRKAGITYDSKELLELVINRTGEALELTLLTQFEIDRCEVLILPDDCYE